MMGNCREKNRASLTGLAWTTQGEAGVAEDVATEVDRVAGGLLGHVYVTPIHRMAPEQVAAEKSVLKRKLRAFDSYFLVRATFIVSASPRHCRTA